MFMCPITFAHFMSLFALLPHALLLEHLAHLNSPLSHPQTSPSHPSLCPSTRLSFALTFLHTPKTNSTPTPVFTLSLPLCPSLFHVQALFFSGVSCCTVRLRGRQSEKRNRDEERDKKRNGEGERTERGREGERV